MLHVGSREHATHGLRIGLAVALAPACRLLAVGLHFGPLGLGRPLPEHRMLGSDHHKRGAKNGVGAGRKHFEHVGFAHSARSSLLVASSLAGSAREHFKPNPRPLASANPVALRLFDAVAPVQLVEAVEQALGKGADAH